MSTYLYIKCLDHDPPLFANDESGQHLYDLPQIRADIRNRDTLLRARQLEFVTDDYFRGNTLRFLAQHPKCNLGIEDEYGREHSLTGENLTVEETE